VSDDDYGALYASVNASSLDGQRRFLNATRVRLIGLVFAAIGGAFTATTGRVDLAGFIGLVAFVAALSAEFYIVYAKPDRLWYEGRAAAESVKTLAWRYMVRADPFQTAIPNHEADPAFVEALKDILHDLKDLDVTPVIAADEQIPDEMRRVRASALKDRQRAYERGRVEDQRVWYAKKARLNEERWRRLSYTAIGLEFLGVLGAAFKAFSILEIDLLGPVAAAAAGLVAWSQAKQYQMLNRAYFVASQELATIRSQIDHVASEKDWSEFVQDAEEAISREHTLWRASRGVVARRA
jgi:SMODS and SLOG-associating 2TM effector domain 3/SMODS and SLOG-associating 2TM effector domain 1